MNINEAKQILNDAGYILHKNPVCNEGILHNIGNFAKRTILGDNKLDQMIDDEDDEILCKVLRVIRSAIHDYAFENGDNGNGSIDYIYKKYVNDDKLINAIKQTSEMFAHDIVIAQGEGDNEKARKLFKNAGTRIVNIIKRGY